MYLERGDLLIHYRWSSGVPGDHRYPGEPPHAEDVKLYWRGGRLKRIREKNMNRIYGEIERFEARR